MCLLPAQVLLWKVADASGEPQPSIRLKRKSVKDQQVKGTPELRQWFSHAGMFLATNHTNTV